jgi:hypothetical protein
VRIESHHCELLESLSKNTNTLAVFIFLWTLDGMEDNVPVSRRRSIMQTGRLRSAGGHVRRCLRACRHRRRPLPGNLPPVAYPRLERATNDSTYRRSLVRLAGVCHAATLLVLVRSGRYSATD